MRVIINADDFGMTDGVTYGIFDAMENGIVTSTTMMMNMRATHLASELLSLNGGLNVGLHLNITLGKPISECESLVNEKGEFMKPPSWQGKKFIEEEIAREFSAQYERFLMLNNRRPTHMDSHLYAHQVDEDVKRQAFIFAEKKGVPLRDVDTAVCSAAKFIRSFRAEKDDTPSSCIEKLKTVLVNLSAGANELMVHPGFVDYELYSNSSYSTQRFVELEALKSQEIKDFITDKKIQLISYRDIVR